MSRKRLEKQINEMLIVIFECGTYEAFKFSSLFIYVF